MSSYFAQNLKILRKERNWTQPELASRIGYSVNEIWMWESGKSEPHLPGIIAIASAFAIPIDDLLLKDMKGD